MIRGGTVVDATGTRRADVAVSGGRIVAVAPGLDAGSARQLDAGSVLGIASTAV